MLMYALFYIIFLTSTSLAAAAALICDVFFFISLRHRRLKVHETKKLQTFCGISTISSTISIASLICLMSFRVANGITPGEGFLVCLVVLLLCAFTCSLIMRNIHLPSLKRHQHEYHHISETFQDHQNGLLSASTVSFVSWLFIITLIAADSRDLIQTANFWNILLSYIVVAFVLSKLVIYTKKKIR